MVVAVPVAMCGAVPVIAGLPGMLMFMAVAAPDLIAHTSQHPSPGRLQHLDNNHAGAPAAKAQESTARNQLLVLLFALLCLRKTSTGIGGRGLMMGV